MLTPRHDTNTLYGCPGPAPKKAPNHTAGGFLSN